MIFGGSGLSLCLDVYPYVFRYSNGNLYCFKVNSVFVSIIRNLVFIKCLSSILVDNKALLIN